MLASPDSLLLVRNRYTNREMKIWIVLWKQPQWNQTIYSEIFFQTILAPSRQNVPQITSADMHHHSLFVFFHPYGNGKLYRIYRDLMSQLFAVTHRLSIRKWIYFEISSGTKFPSILEWARNVRWKESSRGTSLVHVQSDSHHIGTSEYV